ncbi:hypothetical protein B0H13DRAFT_2182539 [Mycena leptocephala]|nr:hypothetical protein B0H13DRAFT_2182539 [Mycena leptocephala]
MARRLLSLCLFFFSTAILAAPFDSLTVYDPPLTSPTAQTIWTVGDTETVTWNATGIPPGITGQLMLGYLTSDSEHLSTTLASGFNLTDQKVKITVPQVVSRPNYIVVLLGSSGNISPEFTIQGSDSSSVSSGSASVAATSFKPSRASTDLVGSPTQTLSNTPSPPISASFPASTSSAPISTTTASSSGPASSSSSLPTSASPAISPSPSPSNNAGWSMNKLRTYRIMLTPVAFLLFI